ncbi:glycosyltransferase family 2 protein [Nocardia caishijiensis]|uniref:Glycosyl transferase family 2 n=1 Tax=Nocardia caishijiensis TaxID=184756 RepID=A0ABQ6YGE1_9NOCA|nr:glycosyltransferase family 2 protein [Nocardia caishijiensis]KAF0842464.1 glycosyl transferase family 2 [Nocardia caishijiensis]
MGAAGRYLTWAGTGLAVLGAGTATYNLATLRTLPRQVSGVIEPVTVCVPARDEAGRLPDLITDLRAQTGVPRLRVLILDDASTDGTYEAALAAIAGDERFTVLRSAAHPAPGWTGKAAACARLAARTDAAALVFVDADVRLRPQAIAAAVTELRKRGAGLVSAWPTQDSGSVAEQLVQPLLAWSWASTLPVGPANHSLRPSTAVACGQFLAVDAAAYRAGGGHAGVAASATEDLDLARALRRAGHRTALVTAGPAARTRMYTGADDLAGGYIRWLWSAYGGRVDTGAAIGVLAALAYWIPPLAVLAGRGRVRRAGLLGYLAAVTGRLTARVIETRRPPTGADLGSALAHPVSVGYYLTLWARSHRLHRTGRLRWKQRPLVAPEAPLARHG